MRLTELQKQRIKQALVDLCGVGATVKLFGSRLDDSKKGGDIDLLVQIDHEVSNPALLVAKIQANIIRNIGEQKIDVLLIAPNLPRLRIHEIAYEQGVLL